MNLPSYGSGGQKPQISITEQKWRCQQGSIPSGSPMGESISSPFPRLEATCITWHLTLPVFLYSREASSLSLWPSASVVTCPSLTLTFLPLSYKHHPESSSHPKILNCISSAKSLLPCKVLWYSQVSGSRMWTSLGTMTPSSTGSVWLENTIIWGSLHFQTGFPPLQKKNINLTSKILLTLYKPIYQDLKTSI